MNIELLIELTSPNYYAEVKQDTKLPFLPYVGLELQLAILEGNNPDIEEDQEREQSPVIGIVTVDRTLYNIGNQKLYVTSVRRFATNDELLDFIYIFRRYYGFEEVCKYLLTAPWSS